MYYMYYMYYMYHIYTHIYIYTYVSICAYIIMLQGSVRTALGWVPSARTLSHKYKEPKKKWRRLW